MEDDNRSLNVLERHATGETLDDFTMAYVTTESQSRSIVQKRKSTVGASAKALKRRRADERESDFEYVRAIANALMRERTKVLPFVALRRLARIARESGKWRGEARASDVELAREAVARLRECDARAPAIAIDDSWRLRDDAHSRLTVVLNDSAWTPIVESERERANARLETDGAAAAASDGDEREGGSAKAREWSAFDFMLDASVYCGRDERMKGERERAVRARRSTTSEDFGRGKRPRGETTRDSDKDSEDEHESEEDGESDGSGDECDPRYEYVGAKLLFLHSCEIMARDARVRLAAIDTWKAEGETEARRAAGLAQNSLLYRLVVDLAPSEGDRSSFFSKLIDAACLASERAAAQASDGDAAMVSASEYYAEDGSKTSQSRNAISSVAHAPTVLGCEDCGVFEISSAARDMCELLVDLLDAAEVVEGASRRHSKIRVQLEDAYAMAWKSTGKARLGDARAKEFFMREIRNPARRLERAREILSRVVDRRHAPKLLTGGLGEPDGAGARDVFDYVSADVVRAIKTQQQSEGSSDFADAAQTLGIVVAAAAFGAAATSDPNSYAASLDACVDALEREFVRSGVRAVSAMRALALARSRFVAPSA